MVSRLANKMLNLKRDWSELHGKDTERNSNKKI